MDNNPGKRRPDEFYFEKYVERQFHHLHERLNSMGIDIAGLEVAEEVLSEAIPTLISEVNTLHTEKTAEEEALKVKVGELEAKQGEVAHDEEQIKTVEGELATAKGELSQVESIVQKLKPAVEEAEKVLPPKPAEEPVTEEPTNTATAPTQPVYSYTAGEGTTEDARFTASGFQAPAAEGAAATPLLYFSEDPPNQTLTANGGAVAGYTQYTGATEAVPAA